MWSYLKSDIAELVSVVKEDTSTVFEKVSNENEIKRPSPALKEAMRRMNEEDTFTVPLFTLDTIPVVAEATETEANETESNDGTKDVLQSPDSEQNEDAWDPADMAEAKEVETFRASFNIKECTDEIASYLEQYPDTLRVQFEALVPQVVSYEEFWERFFHRCNEERIATEWAAEDERARQARVELVGSVSNFFGVAAKAVATGVANALDSDERHDTHRPKGGALQGLFGGTGRPPFVMNTAVDEDDDVEEEELGWDDDEDEDVDEPAVGGTALHDDVEQIVFKDEALDSVTEQLKQAIEERDQLHQTVKLQTKEIVSLKESNAATQKQVDDLRAELQAQTNATSPVAAPVDSLSGDGKADAEIQRLVDLVAAKEAELSAVQRTNATNNENISLTVEALKKENEFLSQELETANSEAATRVAASESEVASKQSEIVTLKSELEQTKQRLAASSTEIHRLNTELEQERASRSNEMAAHVEGDSGSGTKSADTFETASTGVKVETPTVVSKTVGSTDDDEEGWGDDWD